MKIYCDSVAVYFDGTSKPSTRVRRIILTKPLVRAISDGQWHVFLRAGGKSYLDGNEVPYIGILLFPRSAARSVVSLEAAVGGFDKHPGQGHEVECRLRERVIGVPISRADAIEIAHATLLKAERGRQALVEREAQRFQVLSAPRRVGINGRNG